MHLSQESYFYLCKVSLSAIYKAEIRAILPFQWPTTIKAPSHLFLYTHHTYVPYKVKTWKVMHNTIVITLDHFELLTQEASSRQGYDIFIDWKSLCKALQHHNTLDTLLFCRSFKVINKKEETLGVMKGIQPRKIQPLILIKNNEKEIEIPVDKAFIKAIDINKKTIKVAWPPD